MSAYYNEIDPYAAEWLRNLITKGLIPDGEVDTRSIVDVAPDDLRAFTQCHFFAGIGGWSHALRLAGWPDDRPVWTGSCPCQPFSVAGKGAGVEDARHLWPHFHRLIAACRPPVVMGEQVAGKAGYGWFDGVRSDLEGTGYAGRAVDIPALAVNAPHIRQRLYWVATDLENADCWHGKCGQVGQPIEICSTESGTGSDNYVSGRRSLSDMEIPQHAGWDANRVLQHGKIKKQMGQGETSSALRSSEDGNVSHMADADQGGRGRRPRDGDGERDGQAGGRVEDHGVAAGGGEDRLDVADAEHFGFDGGTVKGSMGTSAEEGRMLQSEGLRSAPSFWDDYVWLAGSDGKARRSQPGLRLLAHGVSNRVGRLRAYGNAIVPPLAAEVIRAFMECEP